MTDSEERPGATQTTGTTEPDWAYLTGLAATNADGSGDRPAITVIHRNDSATVILLSFRAGQSMTEHTAAHPIVVLGQAGEIDFAVEGVVNDLRPGTAVRVNTRTPHALTARTDAAATLIVVHGR